MQRRKRPLVVTLLLVLLVSNLANAKVGFQTPVSYPVGTGPTAVAVTDLNGDGTPDLAVANSGSGDVSILLGNGDGTFQATVNFDAGMSNPEALATGDFNQDGKLDLAVFQRGDPNALTPGVISILLGKGDGGFQDTKTLVLTSTAVEMAIADFNLDKKSDIAVSDFDPGTTSESIDIFLGKGDGTFQSAKQTSVPGGGSLANAAFTAADISGEGKPDLAVSGLHTIDIYLGNGDGTFRQSTSIPVRDMSLPDPPLGNLHATFFATAVQIADVNNDGKADVVVLAEGFGAVCLDNFCTSTRDRAEKVSVFLGTGGRSFQEEQRIAAAVRLYSDGQLHGNQIFGFVLGDFDSDGTIDVADRNCSDSGACTLEVWLWQVDGTFALLALPDAGPLLLAPDLRADQLADLVVLDLATANTIDVLLNTTPAFSMTASAQTLTANSGQQVTDTLTIAGHNGFSADIHLSCEVTGPAPLPTCALSPTDITAGANPTTSLLTISTPANAAGLVSPGTGSLLPPLYAFAIPFGLLGLCPVRMRAGSAARRWLQAMSLAAAALVYGACGGSNNIGDSPNHESNSYSVSVAATSSTITKTLKISLTIP